MRNLFWDITLCVCAAAAFISMDPIIAIGQGKAASCDSNCRERVGFLMTPTGPCRQYDIPTCQFCGPNLATKCLSSADDTDSSEKCTVQKVNGQEVAMSYIQNARTVTCTRYCNDAGLQQPFHSQITIGIGSPGIKILDDVLKLRMCGPADKYAKSKNVSSDLERSTSGDSISITKSLFTKLN